MNPTLVSTTEAVDTAFYVIVGISAVFLVGIFLAMLWFIWRYNRKRQPEPLTQKDQNIPLEIVWTVVPTILVIVMFWYGWEGYLSLRNIPEDAMPVDASARMWSWLFTYENGKTADKLYVPVGRPIKVKLTAEDVLHSFYVPAFRVKRDTVPGMTNYVWFVAEEPGSYNLFCAEYCGVGHADMITTVEAMPPEEFQEWLAAEPEAADAGRSLLQKHGCLGCHSLDGSKGVGPTLQNIANKQVVVTTDGKERTLTADRDYLESSILNPNDDVVKGYPPAMPSYQGRIPEEELQSILDYLMSGPQAPSQAAPEEGRAEAEKPPTSTEEAPADKTAAEQAAAAETASQTTETDAEAAAEKPAEKTEQTQAKTDGEEEPAAEPQAAPGEAKEDLVARGEKLANQNGCLGCHSLDGSRKVGPTLQGLFGSQSTIMRDGEEMTVTVDSAYLERALRQPNADIVKGFPPAMPPLNNLSDADIKALVAWMESL